MRVTVLSGGVGGARLAVGLQALPQVELTVIVNVGDDDTTHGLSVSPDVDTVVYTLAGLAGPLGWGRSGDSFDANEILGLFGLDNRFQLGDKDLGLKLFRTVRLSEGELLSDITAHVARCLEVPSRVLPATNDRVRTMVEISDGSWLTFQEYFVHRGHADSVSDLRFAGADLASPAPDVLESLEMADLIVIAPSNPPLSIWPILAVPGIRETISLRNRVTAVSPLFGGRALKGPADRVMASLGLPAGNRGVAQAYEGIIDRLVIDSGDSDDAETLQDVEVLVENTRIADVDAAARLGAAIIRR